VSENRFASFVVAVVGAGVVAVLLQFNCSTTSYDRYLVGNFIALLFVPMLTILFVLREDPDKFGFTLGSWNRISAPVMMLYAQMSYGLYMLCWEFFFRGYLLFGMLRSIGWSAVLVQAAAFGLLHLGKPVTEQVASYIAGVVLGIIALNAKSFVPCFSLHWLASISFDLLVVANRPQ
jgi:membrane protease YdiL (CAAX protease family)